MDALENRMRQSRINMVAVGAGRVDWTYFKWEGHPDRWSGDVTQTGTDVLAEQAARFGVWADHVSAVVDVFAARYLQAHPEAAAITADGKPSQYLVSTTQLVEGEFGKDLLEMLDYIAANYPVDSISLTELAYRIEGYGNDDKAAFMAYTGRSDWPRLSNGTIDIDHTSIGDWRSHEVGRFLEKAAGVVHGHGKQLFLDVNVSWANLGLEANEYGQKYGLMLQYADRIVVWDYFGLSGYKPEHTTEIAAYLAKYGPDRVIISIGMWSTGGGVIMPGELRRGMLAALQSRIPNLWITPSKDLGNDHWRVLTEVWAGAGP